MPNAFNLPLPPNTTDIGVLTGYLYSISEQLNIALNQLDNGISGTTTQAETKAVTAAKEAATGAVDNLRSLIIKSADIVRSYTDERVSSLSGEYLALSDFGTYRENTKQTITENSTSITRLFESVSAVQGTATDADNLSKEISGYIKQGLIPIDGVERIGIAIAERVEVDEDGRINTSNNMCVITTDRLSFWLNGNEVAYFSSSELHVKDIAVNSNITFYGNWEMSSANGLTLKWIGGEDE